MSILAENVCHPGNMRLNIILLRERKKKHGKRPSNRVIYVESSSQYKFVKRKMYCILIKFLRGFWANLMIKKAHTTLRWILDELVAIFLSLSCSVWLYIKYSTCKTVFLIIRYRFFFTIESKSVSILSLFIIADYFMKMCRNSLRFTKCQWRQAAGTQLLFICVCSYELN